jgi:TonB family protein
MTFEAPSVPGDTFSSFRSCLVEGDPQSEERARRIKQRAVAASIVLQSLALTALVLYPLLGKSERIFASNLTPIPPYAGIGKAHHSTPSDPIRAIPRPCGRVCAASTAPVTVPTHGQGLASADGNGDDLISRIPPTAGIRDSLILEDRRAPIAPPPDVESSATERRKVSELQQMAHLINRIQPDYPKLAMQMGREGRVELHAIIGADGTIESLEVISGDPFFFRSALAAVRQWRYRPTILDGRPIGVDTHITVIYTLNH